MIDTIDFKINNEQTRLDVDGDSALLWVLRSRLELTGVKCGCGVGACGACTVLLDREAVRSCQVPMSEVKGKEVLTIEGLASDGHLHPLQKAFVEHNALQCGFCTPGVILTAYSLLLKNPNPTKEQIMGSLEDNLCRCGSHQRVVQAVRSAAKRMKG